MAAVLYVYAGASPTAQDDEWTAHFVAAGYTVTEQAKATWDASPDASAYDAVWFAFGACTVADLDFTGLAVVSDNAGGDVFGFITVTSTGTNTSGGSATATGCPAAIAAVSPTTGGDTWYVSGTDMQETRDARTVTGFQGCWGRNSTRYRVGIIDSSASFDGPRAFIVQDASPGDVPTTGYMDLAIAVFEHYGVSGSSSTDSSLAAELPTIESSFETTSEFDASLAAELPAIESSFETTSKSDSSLAAELPAIESSFETTGSATSTVLAAELPALEVSFETTSESGSSFAATLPALEVSFDTGSSIDAVASGVLPAVEARFRITTDFPDITLAISLLTHRQFAASIAPRGMGAGIRKRPVTAELVGR